MIQILPTIHVTVQNEAISFRKPTTVGTFTEADGKAFAGNGGFISTLLDVINPLQHIPVLSNIFRAATGSSISPAANVLGGALFGGPIGLLAGIADAASTSTTGKGMGQNMLAMLAPSPATATAQAPVQVASNNVPVTAQSITKESMQGNAAGDTVQELFSAPPAGQDFVDWYHDGTLPPAPVLKAHRAYTQAQAIAAR